MNEEFPIEIQDFDFPEMTNNQVNIWRLRDELNATRRWLRENTVSEETEGKVVHLEFEDVCLHPNSYQIKPGLMRCKDCRSIYKV